MDYALLRKIAVDCFKVDRPIDVRAPIITVAGDNSRSVFHNGKYYAPLIDTIEDDLAAKGIECISIARIISTIRGELSYGRVYSLDGAFARALVQKRLLALILRDRYPFSGLEEAAWGRVLEATKATRVLAIQPSRELCVACHRRGIWVADVQHGVIAHVHPWYGETFRAHEQPEYLPSAFLCWDYGSERTIKSWAHAKGISTIVIGNRWLARFQKPSAGDKLVKELSGNYKLKVDEQGRKTILVSLSWGEGHGSNGFMAEGLLRAIQDSVHVYRWLIRLHPNQVRGFAKHEGTGFLKYFDANLAGRAEWESATFAPLPVILRHTDLHISWSSSVCIEAAQMGIKSALLNPLLSADCSPEDYFSYEREQGLVEFIPATKKDVLAWAARNIDAKQSAAADLSEQADAAYQELIDFLST